MLTLLPLLSRLITTVAAGLLMAGGSAVWASPAVITAGQALRFEVDMSGLAPPPPYTEVQFLLGFDIGNSVSGESHITFFTESGGQGTGLVDPFVSIGDLFNFALTDPGFLDGVFSVDISVVSGQVAVDPKVVGLQQTPRGLLQTETLGLVGQVIDGPQNNVPEPTGLALALLGLLSLAASRGQPPRKG